MSYRGSGWRLKGLGFTLLQNDHPVTYASRALLQAERKYSQIKKELKSLVFGPERNHQYVYGLKVILWTDHKLLVSISLKPLSSALRRLQWLLWRLLQYNTEIHYKPGTEMLLADTLSSAYLGSSNRSAVDEETEIWPNFSQFLVPLLKQYSKQLERTVLYSQ